MSVNKLVFQLCFEKDGVQLADIFEGTTEIRFCFLVNWYLVNFHEMELVAVL